LIVIAKKTNIYCFDVIMTSLICVFFFLYSENVKSLLLWHHVMTSLMRSHFGIYAFLHQILVFFLLTCYSIIMQKPAVGTRYFKCNNDNGTRYLSRDFSNEKKFSIQFLAKILWIW